MSTKKRKTPPAPRPPQEDSRRTKARFVDSARTVIVETADGHADEPPREAFDDDKTAVGAAPEAEPAGAGFTATFEQAQADSSGRLTPTLLRIFARRRTEIGISVEQVARLSGISHAVLERFEHDPAGHQITYDQAVVLARVLGIPSDLLPGLRRRESRVPLDTLLADLERTLLGAPLLRFEGQHGERFGGDVERAAASKAFTVRIDDDSLQPALQRGSLLGFVSAARARRGGTLLLRHRRSTLLAMRRYEPPFYVGVLPWQPTYPVAAEWHLCGALEVLLPPR